MPLSSNVCQLCRIHRWLWAIKPRTTDSRKREYTHDSTNTVCVLVGLHGALHHACKVYASRLGVFTFHSGGFIPTCSMVQQNLRTQAPPMIRPKLRLNLGQWFSSFNSTTSRFLSKPINPAKMESLFWLLMACHDWCTRGISRLSCLEYPIRLGHFCAIGQTNQLLEN